MQYSNTNLTVSMYQHLSTALRSFGYDVFWHATATTDAETTGGGAVGTVTLIEHLPRDPTHIVHADVGNYNDEQQLVVPAFALRVLQPRKLRRYGIGDPRFEREVEVRIQGFAANARQHSTLASKLYEWLDIGDVNYYLDVWDYESDPASPPLLDPVEVWTTIVDTPEIAHEVDAIRYQIQIQLILRFVE